MDTTWGLLDWLKAEGKRKGDSSLYGVPLKDIVGARPQGRRRRDEPPF